MDQAWGTRNFMLLQYGTMVIYERLAHVNVKHLLLVSTPRHTCVGGRGDRRLYSVTVVER